MYSENFAFMEPFGPVLKGNMYCLVKGLLYDSYILRAETLDFSTRELYLGFIKIFYENHSIKFFSQKEYIK